MHKGMPRFLEEQAPLRGPRWAVIGGCDSRGSLWVWELTHHRDRETFYYTRDGDVRSIRSKNVFGLFETEAEADTARNAGWAAWDGHKAAVDIARRNLRQIEAQRMTDHKAAIQRLSKK